MRGNGLVLIGAIAYSSLFGCRNDDASAQRNLNEVRSETLHHYGEGHERCAGNSRWIDSVNYGSQFIEYCEAGCTFERDHPWNITHCKDSTEEPTKKTADLCYKHLMLCDQLGYFCAEAAQCKGLDGAAGGEIRH